MSLRDEISNVARSAWDNRRLTLEVALTSGVAYLGIEGIATLKSPACSFETYLTNLYGMTHKLVPISELSGMFIVMYDYVNKKLFDYF